jgi:4-amino-4-deoxy-L-arabinose transferase-like glycosyltransferase
MSNKAAFDYKNISCVLWLTVIVCVAIMIRVKGVWFGFPLSVHSDEPRLVNTALRMIETGDLNPHFFNYPTLTIYIQACLYQIINYIGHAFGISLFEGPIVWFHIIGRSFSVLLSVLTIIITFIIGNRLFSHFAGLLAAFFLTF